MSESRALTIATWFLAISFAVGAPVMMVTELLGSGPSQRFGYPPAFIHFVGVLQTLGGIAVLWRPLASWAAAGLAVIMVGAMATHFNVGRPLAALPAFAYLVLLLGFAWRQRAHALVLGSPGHEVIRGDPT